MSQNAISPHLTEKISQLPHKPGVYIYRDQLNRVIYVGKARDLKKRVSQYFHPSHRWSADMKTSALLDAVHDLEFHVVRSETEALLLEGRLIKEYRPRYNISFRDDKRFLLVRVDLNEPYPRLTTVRQKKDDGATYYGPFAHSGALRSTLAHIKARYGIRSCRSPLPGEKDYKHCLDHIIKNCSAPCIAKISREEYLERVKQACEFLEGRSRELLKKLEEEMHRAAEKLDFERAADIRNLLADLKKTTRPTRRFKRHIPTTVLPEEDIIRLQEVLALPRRPRHIECFDISNISTTHKVASAVVFRDGRPDRYNYRRYRIKTVAGQDDFASMREALFRRYRRMLGLKILLPGETPPETNDTSTARETTGKLPDLIVVDGGKGQLSAAYDAFAALGVRPPPIIGLAKQREEIFAPDLTEPIVLPHTDGALRLLQRIRDEAHRTANAYHQLLLERRIQESALDAIPGISARRKEILLSHFGSVTRLKNAPVEKIAQLPNIGPKLAAEIHAYFCRTNNTSLSQTPPKTSAEPHQ
jgi:excinuclease ABC subunit C